MTWEYLATTGGAIAVTILITNALRQAFGWRAAWVALVVAFALGLTAAWIIEHPVVIPFIAGWVLAMFVAVGMSAAWGDV